MCAAVRGRAALLTDSAARTQQLREQVRGIARPSPHAALGCSLLDDELHGLSIKASHTPQCNFCGTTPGFLPSQPELSALPADFQALEHLMRGLPRILGGSDAFELERTIQAFPELDVSGVTDSRVLHALYRDYSFLAAAYLHLHEVALPAALVHTGRCYPSALEQHEGAAYSLHDQTAGAAMAPAAVPACIAVPLQCLARRLGQPMALTFDSLVSGNVVHVDDAGKSHPAGTADYGRTWPWHQLQPVRTLLGGPFEAAFICILAEAEGAGAAIVAAVERLLRAASQGLPIMQGVSHELGPEHLADVRLPDSLLADLRDGLIALAGAQDAMIASMLKLFNSMPPEYFRASLSPLLAGSVANVNLAHGVQWEGIRAEGCDQFAHGFSLSQSAAVPAMEAILGIEHEADHFWYDESELALYRPRAVTQWLAQLRASLYSRYSGLEDMLLHNRAVSSSDLGMAALGGLHGRDGAQSSSSSPESQPPARRAGGAARLPRQQRVSGLHTNDKFGVHTIRFLVAASGDAGLVRLFNQTARNVWYLRELHGSLTDYFVLASAGAEQDVIFPVSIALRFHRNPLVGQLRGLPGVPDSAVVLRPSSGHFNVTADTEVTLPGVAEYWQQLAEAQHPDEASAVPPYLQALHQEVMQRVGAGDPALYYKLYSEHVPIPLLSSAWKEWPVLQRLRTERKYQRSGFARHARQPVFVQPVLLAEGRPRKHAQAPLVSRHSSGSASKGSSYSSVASGPIMAGAVLPAAGSSSSSSSWTTVTVSDYEVLEQHENRDLQVGSTPGHIPGPVRRHFVGRASSDSDVDVRERMGQFESQIRTGERPGRLPKRWVEVTELTSESGSDVDSGTESPAEFEGRKEQRAMRRLHFDRREHRSLLDRLLRRRRAAHVHAGSANILAGQTAPLPGSRGKVRGRALAAKAVFLVDSEGHVLTPREYGDRQRPRRVGQKKQIVDHPRARGRAVFRYGPRGNVRGHIHRGDDASDASSLSMTMQAEATMLTNTHEVQLCKRADRRARLPTADVVEHRERREIALGRPSSLRRVQQQQRRRRARPVVESGGAAVLTAHRFAEQTWGSAEVSGSDGEHPRMRYGRPEPMSGKAYFVVQMPKRKLRASNGRIQSKLRGSKSESSSGPAAGRPSDRVTGAVGEAVFRMGTKPGMHRVDSGSSISDALDMYHSHVVQGAARMTTENRQLRKQHRRLRAYKRRAHTGSPEQHGLAEHRTSHVLESSTDAELSHSPIAVPSRSKKHAQQQQRARPGRRPAAAKKPVHVQRIQPSKHTVTPVVLG